MKLSQRIKSRKGKDGTRTSGQSRQAREKYNGIKAEIHFSLVDRLDLDTVTDLPKSGLAAVIRSLLNEITLQEKWQLNMKERTMLVSELIQEIIGFGPLQAFLDDDSVQDILVNGHRQVVVEKEGLLYPTPVRFRDDKHLMHLIDKIVTVVGRRIDESSPMVDARLPDGSRVNVIIPPLALDGPMLSIRKFGTQRLTTAILLDKLTLSSAMMQFLKGAIHSRLNLLVSGGTGAGKTTLLNILSENIPENERIITIEDSAELQLQQPHVVRLESRPPNVEGKGEVLLSDLVKNSLRMRPDRIIVGESRGVEVIDMLQAMNTGHPGSMSTVHANSSTDAISRLEVMAAMTDIVFSERVIKTLISSAIDLIIHISRFEDGKRRITEISELQAIQDGEIHLKPVFRFEQTGFRKDHGITGVFKGTGYIPEASGHIRLSGIDLPDEIFSDQTEVG